MQYFLSLLIGLLSFIVLPHVSFVHAGEDQGPTDTPMPTLVPCEKNGYTCRYQVCQKNELEKSYSCGSSLLVCCQPIPTTSTPTPTRTTTPSVPPECPYIPATLWCFDSYSPPQLWWCENQRKTTYHSTCGYGCNADKTACNESAYCENWCITGNCFDGDNSSPYENYRVVCWKDRECRSEDPDDPMCQINPPYWPPAPTPQQCSGLIPRQICNGCHPITESCGGGITDCPRLYAGDDPSWTVSHIDNCGGQQCGPPCGTPVPTSGAGTPAPTLCVPPPCPCCLGETCSNTACGGTCEGSTSCPVTIVATAKLVNATTMPDCVTDVLPAPFLNNGSITFSLSGYGPPPPLQYSSGSDVRWTNIEKGTGGFTISQTSNNQDYRFLGWCQRVTGDPVNVYSSYPNFTLQTGQNAMIYAAYGPPGPWHQTQEGDVYSGGTLQTYIPSTVPAANRLYSLLGAGGTAGVISAGSLSVVPTPAWRVTNQTNPAQNFYASYRRKAATTTRTPLPAGTVSSFPASSTVYTTTGDLTFGNGSTLTVPDGVSVVYLVDGNVTITQPLTLANPNTSFLAIIASGTISVASTITGSSANPGLDGVFLAGTFRDLEQTPPASPHTPLFVRGLVAANTVTLLRDNADRSVPSDTFIYNPALPFTMPEWMKDLYYEWREVAP